MSENLYSCPHCGKELDATTAFNEICPGCHKGFNVSNLNPKLSSPKNEQPKQSQPSTSPVTYSIHLFPPDDIQPGEKVIFLCHPSRAYFLLPLAIVPLWGFVMMSTNRFFGWLLFFGGAIALFFRFLQWRNTVYGFTDKRLLKHSGILSKQFYETKLKRVQDITIKIDWVKSFFNCGDIAITTAGTAGVECAWESIPDPKGVKNLLNSYLEQKEDNSL